MTGRRQPYATWTLIVINAVVFVVCLVQARSAEPSLSPLLLHGELVRGSVFAGEYWRLLTAGFLHYSIVHIAVNMVSLYILGRDLETALGRFRLVAVYLTSLFGGSAAVMVFQPDIARSAGASGAIFGLMGGLLVVVLRMRVSPVPVLVIIGINLVMTFSLANVSLPAHVGGLLFGAAATAAIVYLPAAILPEQHRDRRSISRIGLLATAALLVLAIGISAVVVATHTGLDAVYVEPLV